MKFLQTMGLGWLVMLCASCAHFQPNLSPTAKPDPASAIFYGHFYLKHTYSAGLKIALWLQSVDTQKATYICFDESQPFCAVRVKPGTYQIAGFLATDRTHENLGRRSLTPAGPGHHITRPFLAAPGSQTYLGDFTAEATFDGIIQHWQLKGIANNFTASTVEFREKYPQLMTGPAVSIFDLSQTDR